MTTIIADQKQRQQALEPTQSFIVQAPAGSGKTELLTQRFLKLLITVEHDPEEVLAITFTRKAANEMRQRIFSALQLGKTFKPKEPHHLQTWQLAQQVLKRDQQENWQLLNNPNRLRIQTIDSLCAYLAQQLPISSRLGSTVNIVEDAQSDYINAIDAILATLEDDTPWASSLETLLRHLDNNLNQVRNLLIVMLSHRDQWLPHIIKARNNKDLRQHLEISLGNLIAETLQQLHASFPKEERQELLTLLTHAHTMLQQDGKQIFITDEIPSNFPTANLDDLNTWQAIATLLLTKKYEWRRSFDKRIGFPITATTQAEKLKLRDFKERIINLVEKLTTETALLSLLRECLILPAPHYNETQWKILTALMELLPILVAQLNVNFQQAGHIDFIEITQRALQALEDEENPADLALALDYKIKHILLDEFQDTSTTQFYLLELLTRGWQINDGRTLLLVGDPMQSIYRFRAAEVGLFLQAKRYGIGDIKLTPLTLSTNFRSSTAIVEWFNKIFSHNFPKKDDIALGAISYTSTTANQQENLSETIYLHQCDPENVQHEAETIIDIIKNSWRQDAQQEIAILVRTRRQLFNIIPYLKQANLQFNAVDIESLNHLPMIQDLTSLTLAMQHFGNRLTWLSILRAPWCGLTLQDLHCIASNHLEKTIWQGINEPTIQAKLTNDGRQRIKQFIFNLNPILAQRGRFSLSEWVYNAWIKLQGPSTLQVAHQLQNSQLFFSLLAQLEQDGSIEKMGNLADKLNTLYAQPTTNHKLHIMTIHKAKGLEFDTVIMPSLENTPAHDTTKLLLWQERPTVNNQRDLLFAPIKSRAEEQDTIYNYVRHFEQKKSNYENMRLFYVGVTRSKKYLHLLANFNDEEYKPRNNSFLNAIWEQEQNQFKQYYKSKPYSKNSTIGNLKRIPLSAPINDINIVNEEFISDNTPNWDNIVPRNLGSIIHFVLQQLNNIPVEHWKNLLQQDKLHTILLQQHRIPISEFKKILPDMKNMLQNIVTSERVAWLFNPNHEAIQVEYSLTVQHDNETRRLIMDRTFIENDIRWIIDYKTARPQPEQNIENFLAQEKQLHQSQLETYAAAFKQLGHHKIKLGLYFPILDAWLEWDYQ